jgi:hypothetical protein
MSMMSDAISVDSGPESEFDFDDFQPSEDKREERKAGGASVARRNGSSTRGARRVNSVVKRNALVIDGQAGK